MNKFITSILFAASLLSPLAASAAPFSRTTQWFDQQYKISDRVRNGSIEPQVRYVHTEHDPVTGIAKELRVKNYEANMCVLERKHCEKGSGFKDCRQFTSTVISCANMQ